MHVKNTDTMYVLENSQGYAFFSEDGPVPLLSVRGRKEKSSQEDVLENVVMNLWMRIKERGISDHS
jgi:hypothetical protein